MSKKLDIDLSQIEALATKGYSVTMICSAIGINRTTAYKNSDIIDTIKRGAEIARQKVVNDLMKRSENDQSATASIFLAKQLKVFEDYYPTATPKTIKEALSKIQDIFKCVADNSLSSDKADKLVHYLEVFIKGFESSEIEDRLKKLEEVHNAK